MGRKKGKAGGEKRNVGWSLRGIDDLGDVLIHFIIFQLDGLVLGR